MHETLFDEFEEPANTGLRLALVVTNFLETLAIALPPVGGLFDVILKKMRQSLRLQYTLTHLANDNAIQLVHADAHASTGRWAFLLFTGTTVIGISATLAAILDQGGAAMTTPRQPRQQRRTIGDARRQFLWAAALQQALNFIEGTLIDDGRDGDLHPLRRRTGGSVSTVSLIEVMFADVGRAMQNFVNATRRETMTTTQNTVIG